MEICTKCGFKAKNKSGLYAHSVKHGNKKLIAAQRKGLKTAMKRKKELDLWRTETEKRLGPKPKLSTVQRNPQSGNSSRNGIGLDDAIKHLEFEQELIGTMIKKLRSLGEVK